MMTFEEALAAPGRIVQLWGSDVIDGNRIQMIYRLADDGAKQLAWRPVPAEQYDVVAEQVRVRGLPVAETEPVCFFIWIITADSVEVYGRRAKVLDARDGRVALDDGRTFLRGDIVRVISFSDADYVYRGVKAELRSGEEIPLVTDVSMAAEAGAGYNRNDLLMETGWTATLGVAIAKWAGTSFDDRIL
jgi:hypothetical protein